MNRKIKDQYLTSDGVLITICKPAKPRRSERTWAPIRGSVFQLGSKAANLRNAGLPHAHG
jgi:hypothetical protein